MTAHHFLYDKGWRISWRWPKAMEVTRYTAVFATRDEADRQSEYMREAGKVIQSIELVENERW